MKDFKTLNQLIAVEKEEKKKLTNQISELHRSSQVSSLLNGFDKKYEALQEGGLVFPPESMKVQVSASEAIEKTAKLMSQLIDMESTKNKTNTAAKADIVVNGEVLVADVPSVTLLSLEKELRDLAVFVEKVVELDPSENWVKDEQSGLFKTGAFKTHRTQKVQKPIVLYDATDKHPAQTQLISTDEIVGHWVMVKTSGAMPKTEKEALLDKINTLLNSVKAAREQANMVQIQKFDISKQLFNFLGLST